MRKIKLFFCSPEVWLSLSVIGLAFWLCGMFSHEAPVCLSVSEWEEALIVSRTEIPLIEQNKRTVGLKLKLDNRQEIIVYDFNKFPELRFLWDKKVGDKIRYRRNPEKPLGKEFGKSKQEAPQF